MERLKADSIQKTEYLLAGAMMRLLEKQCFRKISVRDICKEALVSRSAFYVHFADKYELLKFCLRVMLRRQDDLNGGCSLKKRITELLISIRQNQRFFHNAFEVDISQELIEIFGDTFQEYICAHLNRLDIADRLIAENQQMVSAFLAGGMANMLINWVHERFLTPVEMLVRCQCELILRTLGTDENALEEPAQNMLY